MTEGPRTLKVLIVDDTPSESEELGVSLSGTQDPRFEVETTTLLSDALNRLEGGVYDLVLLDLFLPESKGLKTLSRVRDATDAIIIALTKFDDEGTGVQALREGAQDYLVKGETDTNLFLRSIRHAVERRRAEEALRQSEARFKSMAERLQRLNSELEGFTYSVSHDLRAPLRAILGFSEIIDQDYRAVLDENGQHYLDNIIEAGTQMGWLIDDLLAYSRMGYDLPPVGEVDLGSLLRSVVQGLSERLSSSGGRVDVAPDPPTVQGNPTLLSQVFSNLIGNALVFHRSGVPPVVKVEWEETPEWVRCAVADNGIGIREENFTDIFEVFQRLHQPDEFPGTGIGLSIVRKAVEMHRGRVDVESTVSEGSRFVVSLPKAPQVAEQWREYYGKDLQHPGG